MNQTFQIYKIGKTPYLFSADGLIHNSKDAENLRPTVRFEQMRVWSFLHSVQDIHIVAFGDLVSHVFGRNEDFIAFLKANKVPTKTYQLKALDFQQPANKLKKLIGTTEGFDSHDLFVTASYSEEWMRITIKEKEKVLFDYRSSKDQKSRLIPDLEALDKVPVAHEWTGGGEKGKTPDRVIEYQQFLKTSEQKESVFTILGCLIVVIILGMIIVGVFF